MAVVGATVVTAILDLAVTHGVPVVGPLPQGLPRFELPGITFSDIPPLVAGGAAIALVSMADTSILSRTFAARRGIRVDQDQELLALGAANIATGFFQGFSVSSSSSRTPVAEAAGGRTQLVGVVGALAVAALIMFLPWLTTNLPSATLGAIVIVACWAIVDIPVWTRMWRLRRDELVLSFACFLGVALLGVVPGILVAVVLALLDFVWRAWRPHSAVLGRVDGLKGYHDLERYPDARLVPGLILLRWDAPLFFANAEMFRDRVLEAIEIAAAPTLWVVVAAEPVTDIDLTAADMLAELLVELEAKGMTFAMAELKDPVGDRLKRYGLYERVGREHFFPTLGSAVEGYVAASEVEWVDWEERMRPGAPVLTGDASPALVRPTPDLGDDPLGTHRIIERHVGQGIRRTVVRPRLMHRGPATERPQPPLRFGEEALELGVLDPPSTIQLLDDELRVEPQVDLLRAQPLGLAQGQYQARVLGDVVGPDAQGAGDDRDRHRVRVEGIGSGCVDEHAARGGRSGVAAGRAIGPDDQPLEAPVRGGAPSSRAAGSPGGPALRPRAPRWRRTPRGWRA